MNTNEHKFLIGQRFVFIPHDNSLIDQFEDDEITRLGSNESRALGLLIDAEGTIVTRTRLHDYVWREQGFEVDDSSLTQAISTLRKALKDSTKSPEFIKTVPKRGYQLIAPVEAIVNTPCAQVPSTTDADADMDAPTSAETTDCQNETHSAVNATHTPTRAAVHFATSRHTEHPQGASTPASRTWFFGSVIALLIAFILPIWVNQALPPKSAAFTPILQVEEVPILVPISNPDLTPWQPLITQCVERYIAHHPDDKRPIEVIATGGQNSQIWLNYVHSSQRPSENVTLRLLTSQKDNTTICQ
ncbi:transcriptional regulator [Photobacterium aphoticum]|uniref:Transcriptional regulator n=1 Tax=Photobacterium aphoticum TaxID=754436 RepID=A0A0J1JF19_9GAMM|nr:transcriptional regulator [Photobacterium aphoticum]KLV00262.1 transcriptional regulator [Photobacterium aphoticum]PSU58597.1 transcriptional regulator [Photobacterium aphoticum]GHA48302.1 cholera toxin homolog transcriptional activator [Photobacterium aphoticum]